MWAKAGEWHCWRLQEWPYFLPSLGWRLFSWAPAPGSQNLGVVCSPCPLHLLGLLEAPLKAPEELRGEPKVIRGIITCESSSENRYLSFNDAAHNGCCTPDLWGQTLSPADWWALWEQVTWLFLSLLSALRYTSAIITHQYIVENSGIMRCLPLVVGWSLGRARRQLN